MNPSQRVSRRLFFGGVADLAAAGAAVPYAISSGAFAVDLSGTEAQDEREICLLSERMPGLDETYVAMLADRLRSAAVPVRTITAEELASRAVLAPDRVKTVVLTNGTCLPAAAFENLMAFLRGGGNLLAMGGRAFRQPVVRCGDDWQTPAESAEAGKRLVFREAFDDYAVYDLSEVTCVRTHAAQDWLDTGLCWDGPVAGVSAVGFASPHESTFVPLLAAEDEHGRVRGWAASMLLHHAGQYAESQWGLFGVEDAAFYRDEQVLDLLVRILQGFHSGAWLKRARREDSATAVTGLELTAPKPPPLAIRDGHFVYPDGRRFFMIGVNMFNSFDTFYGGGVQWDVRRLQHDFARMERAGINAVRIHDFGRFAVAREPHRLETFLELCRRHGIYVLAAINVGRHGYLRDGKTAMQAEARRMARLLKDEPALLGYDLQNEPYWWEIAQAPFRGTALGEHFPVPGGAWDEYIRSLEVSEADWTTTFPGLEGPLPLPADPRLRRAYENVNAIMGTWIGWLVEAIRAEDAAHPITVGYNTILGCLPANAPLEFVSHHVYEHPRDLEHVRHNLTTFDRLGDIWSDRPITLGEFGYSSGDLLEGEHLDVYTQAVGEIVHWLYALAQGYDGAMKWQLCDATPAYQWRFATWHRDNPEAERLRERRFGMFWPDGTLEGRPKPIAYATRFLRDCVDEGLIGGDLELRRCANPIGTGYVFRGEKVLFVGGSEYCSSEMRVESRHSFNVMLRWDDRSMTILSTADATVTLDPEDITPGKRLGTAGRDARRALEDAGAGRVRLPLREGVPVTLALADAEKIGCAPHAS